MRPRIPCFLILLGLLFSVGSAQAQGVYNKDAFESTMESLSKGIRFVLSSLIAEDWAKATSSAAGLCETATTIHKLAPKANTDRIGEFHAHADTLAARATRLSTAAKARNREGSTTLLGETLATCMTCHATFRK